jgi:hypothetical protein
VCQISQLHLIASPQVSSQNTQRTHTVSLCTPRQLPTFSANQRYTVKDGTTHQAGEKRGASVEVPNTLHRTKLEQQITRLGGAIRAKSHWRLKMNNSEIVAKWRAEAHLQEFDYVLAELHGFRTASVNDNSASSMFPVCSTWRTISPSRCLSTSTTSSHPTLPPIPRELQHRHCFLLPSLHDFRNSLLFFITR